MTVVCDLEGSQYLGASDGRWEDRVKPLCRDANAHECFLKAGRRRTSGGNCPGTFPRGPRWLFSRREAEFRQFSQWIHSIRPANSVTSGLSLRATLPPRSMNPGDAIGSNVF